MKRGQPVFAAGIAMALFLSAASAWAQAPARVDIVHPRTVEGRQTLQLTGSANTERQAALSPRVSGLVAAVPAEAGHRAEAGDVLLQLDPALAEVDVASAAAALTEAKAQLAEAERLHDEATALGENIPGTTLRARRASVAIAEATVAARQADLDRAREQRDRHRLVAPFDGVVVEKMTDVGEWVQTGTPVFQFVGTGSLRFDVHAPQTYFPRISEQTPAEIRFDAMPERTFDGRLIAKVPFSRDGARTFLVRFEVEAPAADLVPGMSGTAILTLPGRRDIHLIPRDAVVRYPDGSTVVWVLEEKDGTTRAFQRTVTTTGQVSAMVEVTGGLEADARIVVRGNENLQEGQAVEIREVRTISDQPRNPG